MAEYSENNLLFSNDERGRYPNSWYRQSASVEKDWPSLKGEHHTDVAIIGAGFTGLSAALRLRELGYRVTVVDAHRAGWGASGRNGGQLGSGQRLDQETLQTKYGDTHARQLWELAEDAKRLVKQLIGKHDIDCDYRDGIIHTDHKRKFSAGSRAYVEMLRGKYGYENISYLQEEELHWALGTSHYHSGTVDTGAGHLHPLKYALGLARAVATAGGDIFEHSLVNEVKSDRFITVVTDQGHLVAESLVFACNGYLGRLQPSVAARVMPINNFIIATSPLKKEHYESILREDMAVADSRFVVNYFRKSADCRLLFGGRESYGYRFPRDIQSYVRSAMVKIYPQLESTRIEFGWGGTLAITMNRMPQLTALAPNVYSASGYSGHGVGMATLSGHLIADAIDGTLTKFDVMAKIRHRKFPGGIALRSPLMKLGMLYYSLRDKM